MSDCSTNAFKVPEGMCSCNRSRGYDELLQRYQQLEQVAKEMHALLLPGCGKAKYGKKLEALGVSLDG